MYKIFKYACYWLVHKIKYMFYPSLIKHSVFCFNFQFCFSLAIHECMSSIISIGYDIIYLYIYFPRCKKYSKIHSTDLYTKLNIYFTLNYSNILYFAFIFNFPFLFQITNICIIRRKQHKKNTFRESVF